jgi:DivIVA domain-containing protein
MEWILAALVIGIVGLAAAAASGRFGELPDVVDDRVHPVLPEGNLTGPDLRDVQFAVVPRGYSMEQVDALLDRLGSQLDGIQSGQHQVASPGPNNLE